MTTDAFELARRSALALERRHRHLSEDPAEGHVFEGAETVDLQPRRLRRAKKSYNARHLNAYLRDEDFEGFSLLRGTDVTPQPGDFVLARVTTIGQHKRLESHNSRRRHLFQDDEIIVAYGHRYAADQFLSEVPRNLNYTNLVAAGGVASRVIDKHASVEPATVIEPLGLLCNKEGVLNMKTVAPEKLTGWADALDEFNAREKRPTVVMVFGSSMNSGKSTMMGCFVNGLEEAGLSVNAGKATGTGAGNDAGLYRDAGADRVVDFTDFGHATTFKLSFDELKDVVFSMVNSLSADEPDVVMIEIADGIYQGETSALITDPDFKAITDRVLFACGEALSAAAGANLITEAGLPLVLVSGKLTSAPLITAEARQVVDVPVVPTYDLCFGDVATQAGRAAPAIHFDLSRSTSRNNAST